LASAPPAELQPAAPPRRGRIWQGILGVAISIGFLIWALHGVKLEEVVEQLRRADPVWYLLSCLAATSTFPLRALRWRILLASSTPERRLQPYWRAVAIGFMANNVLPARAGEVVRSYAGTALIGVPFSTTLASIAVERVFDGVVLVLLLALAVISPGFPAGATIHSTSIPALAGTMAAIFVGGLVVLIVLVRAKDRAVPAAERLIHRIAPARLAPGMIRVLGNLVGGLGVLHSSRDVFRVLIWSFAVWLANASSIILGFRAFGIDASPNAALVLQGVVAFGVAVPAAPGFFGVFEKLAQLVLGLYGVSGAVAFSFAIGIHMGWFIPITVIGLVILARTGLTLRSLRSGEAATAPAPVP
jgi:uncharacterized protein (TIRG00374 family)